MGLAAALAYFTGGQHGAASVLGFFTIFVAPVFGVLIAEAVRWAVRKRRSPLLLRWRLGALLGALPLLLMIRLPVGIFMSQGGGHDGPVPRAVARPCMPSWWSAPPTTA
jgi:hypothetical protein